MLWARLTGPDGAALAVGNLHGSVDTVPGRDEQVLAAAERAVDWAGDLPLIFGGDLNLRPIREPDVFAELEERFGLAPPTAPDAIDHLLVRGLDVLEPPRRAPAEAREVDAGDGHNGETFGPRIRHGFLGHEIVRPARADSGRRFLRRRETWLSQRAGAADGRLLEAGPGHRRHGRVRRRRAGRGHAAAPASRRARASRRPAPPRASRARPRVSRALAPRRSRAPGRAAAFEQPRPQARGEGRRQGTRPSADRREGRAQGGRRDGVGSLERSSQDPARLLGQERRRAARRDHPRRHPAAQPDHAHARPDRGGRERRGGARPPDRRGRAVGGHEPRAARARADRQRDGRPRGAAPAWGLSAGPGGIAGRQGAQAGARGREGRRQSGRATRATRCSPRPTAHAGPRASGRASRSSATTTSRPRRCRAASTACRPPSCARCATTRSATRTASPCWTPVQSKLGS